MLVAMQVLAGMLVGMVLWLVWPVFVERFRGKNTVVEDAAEAMTREAAEEVVRDLRDGLANYRHERELGDEVVRLKRELAELEAQRGEIERSFAEKAEVFETDRRTIEHELGLHKKRVAWEVEEAGARARLEVEQDNLAEAQKAFEARMEFMTDRFEGEVKYQRELAEQLLERLPTAKVRLTGEV